MDAVQVEVDWRTLLVRSAEVFEDAGGAQQGVQVLVLQVEEQGNAAAHARATGGSGGGAGGRGSGRARQPQAPTRCAIPYFGSRRFRELRLLAGGGKDNTEI